MLYIYGHSIALEENLIVFVSAPGLTSFRRDFAGRGLSAVSIGIAMLVVSFLLETMLREVDVSIMAVP